MAGLKELRTRIETIKSTQKITSAMKMVAAARLRRAQDLLAKSQPYHDSLLKVFKQVYKQLKDEESRLNVRYIFPKMITPRADGNSYLLIAFTSDRGLCGSYNAAIIKETVRRIEELKKVGKNVKLLCIGKKIGDALKGRYGDIIIDVLTGVAGKGVTFEEMERIIEPVIGMFFVNEFDICEFVYAKFKSAITRDVTVEQFLPFVVDTDGEAADELEDTHGAIYEYDAPKQKILIDMVPMILTSAAFQTLINSQASEHGARMTSMDNATRNAKDMIAKLTLKYNRIRQTAITTELIEIIAGAEAL